VELRVATVGRPFRLASPKPSLIKIMPITGLHHRFLTTRVAGQVIPVLLLLYLAT
jgi:hypothetical protein